MVPLLAILLLPVAEIAVFVQVGDWIGAGPTVALVILSAIGGSMLIRRGGLAALKRAQAAAERGELPVGAAFEGFCAVVSGVLLIIPGFITDAVGLVLFVPFLRNALGRWLFERLRNGGPLAGGHVRMWSTGPSSGPGAQPGSRPRPGTAEVIDVEYHEVRTGEPEPGDAPRLSESRWGTPPDGTPRDRG